MMKHIKQWVTVLMFLVVMGLQPVVSSSESCHRLPGLHFLLPTTSWRPASKLSPQVAVRSDGSQWGEAADGRSEQEWWREVLCEAAKSTPDHRSYVLPKLYSDVTPSKTNYNVYLMETTCNPRPSYRAWCAVESWARQNPGAEIWYIMTSLTADDSDGLLSKLLSCYSNLHLVTPNLNNIFVNTPLKNLFQSSNWAKNPAWPAYDLSNFLRNALVWLWGGFYSDADTICMKDVTHLHNVIAYQIIEEGDADNALMHFDAGHRFVYMVMEYLAKNFQNKVGKWQVTGPGVSTKTLEKLCNTTELDDVVAGHSTCQGVTLLSQQNIQPVPSKFWKYYFADGYGTKLEEKFKSVFVLRVWDLYSHQEPVVIGRDSIYDVAARTFCPITYGYASLRSSYF
ncbi:lactosylceramide 4-alpha-galactosyltransferase-like [Homarus americanus]|uniref:Lactosylceramide 4-alpha-galactosyltransferase-like 5 n=1 Tax=Homarus americanus TaxID=6706 RepID=A0A8J5K437_HOMAM|nr:lactosylceramide 4-alpha-galactosyltransferase-like [Homarus americanus]KAG7169081.1 Lactosylceramide 4-alpha-galactosyltransferase-like 5 [Homarus americanus]